MNVVDITDRSDCANVGKLVSDNQGQVGMTLSSLQSQRLHECWQAGF